MDNFFHDINKRLNDIDTRQDITESTVTERDMGKHNNATTGFKALAKKTNPKIAGAQFQKMKKAGQLEEGQCSKCAPAPCSCDSMEEGLGSALASGFNKFNDKMAPIGAKLKGAKAFITHNPKDYQAAADAHNKIATKIGTDPRTGEQYSRPEAYANYNSAKANAGWNDYMKGRAQAGIGRVFETDVEESMEEGAFKNIDIERQERAAKARHKGGLNQVPGVQNLKPDAKEHPLKNVAKGVKAFVQGKPEPLDEVGDTPQGLAAVKRVGQRAQRGLDDAGTGYSGSELDYGKTLAARDRANARVNRQDIRANEKNPTQVFGGPDHGKRMEEEKKARPDFPDIDHDGDTHEPIKKASADKKRSSGTAFDPEHMKKSKTDREGTGNFDKKKVSTGTVYTRRHKEDDEEEVKSDQPKKKGRPKGPAKGPERVTAKSYKYKQGRPVKEMEIPLTSRGEYDQEGDEVKGDMHTVIRHAQELEKHLRDSENLPTWIIEKVGQIKGMMTSISDYMLSQHERSAEQETGQEGIRIAEKAVSVKQRRAAGIAHAAQKGEIPKSELRGASKAMARMPAGELHTLNVALPAGTLLEGKPGIF
jgi:hypothetical protein